MQYEYGEHIFTVLGVIACLNKPIDQVVSAILSNRTSDSPSRGLLQ